LIRLQQVYFLFGTFLLLPIIYIPLGFTNIKFDDLIIILLFALILIKKKSRINIIVWILILLSLLFLISGILTRYNHDFNYDNYPLIRIIGIMLYLFVLSLYIKTKYDIFHLSRGVLFGAKVLIIIMFIFLLSHMVTVGFNIKNLYVIKDSLRGISSFNPNSYGIMMVFASFNSYILFDITKNKNFKLAAILFLIMPFIFIIKRDMLGIFVALVYLYIVTRNYKIRIFYYTLIGIFFIYLIYTLIGLWSNEEFKFLMAHRVGIYTAAFTSIMDNPIGYGIGSEVSVLQPLTGRTNVSHNSFLSIGLDLGIYNMLILLMFLISVFYSYRAIWIKFYFIIFFVQSLFGNGFYYYKYHFIFIALSILYTHLLRKELYYENNTIFRK
jgi:hypothetical protein